MHAIKDGSVGCLAGFEKLRNASHGIDKVSRANVLIRLKLFGETAAPQRVLNDRQVNREATRLLREDAVISHKVPETRYRLCAVKTGTTYNKVLTS